MAVDSRPVMSEAEYNGEAMAQQGIVVVTVNIDSNLFGFLAHPWSQCRNSSTKDPENYGFDGPIRLAPNGKENIEAFGGDPNKRKVFFKNGFFLGGGGGGQLNQLFDSVKL